MSREQYDNQALTRYLLGALPEAETERFDELSFTDDEFTAALEAAERDLIDGYVHGELAGETLEKFRTHYLVSPLRREKVKFAEAFQTVAKRKAAAETRAAKPSAFDAETKRATTGFFSSLSIFTAANAAWRWGAFAAVLALLFAGGWWLNNTRSSGDEAGELAQQAAPAERESPDQSGEIRPPESEKPEKEVASAAQKESEPARQNSAPEGIKKPPASEPSDITRRAPTPKTSKAIVASFVLAPPVRSASRMPELSVPRNASEIAVRLQLESNDYANYRVSLETETGKRLWSSGALRIKSAGELSALDVRFPARHLKPRIFSLVVSGVKTGGEVEIIGNYPFRTVLK